ncbi:MAG TPA: helix-hairpin-helix domain-containing protein [Caulobacteraceae bacterium]|nr:helix-hairpin-helix domain-containing protein [Caulobacteraceae bacterium]
MRRERGRLAPTVLASAIGIAAGLVSMAGAQDIVADMAPLNAEASRLDPDDYPYMQAACTRCHTPAMILHSRTWPEWRDVFDQMVRYGADATPEQWTHIRRYAGRTLSLLDVNHADEDEFAAVLGVDDATAVRLVQRRIDRPFQDIDELEAMPGVDKAAVEAVAPRLRFAPPPPDQ